MIYLDSSVVLARLLFEMRAPPAIFWEQELVSSRLLEYEVWTRVHAYNLSVADRAAATAGLLGGIALLEMERTILARAREPWPVALRTLDALHLATAEYLRQQGQPIALASYDSRLIAAASALAIPLASL